MINNWPVALLVGAIGKLHEPRRCFDEQGRAADLNVSHRINFQEFVALCLGMAS
jgi:hypothetical protein